MFAGQGTESRIVLLRRLEDVIERECGRNRVHSAFYCGRRKYSDARIIRQLQRRSAERQFDGVFVNVCEVVRDVQPVSVVHVRGEPRHGVAFDKGRLEAVYLAVVLPNAVVPLADEAVPFLHADVNARSPRLERAGHAVFRRGGKNVNLAVFAFRQCNRLALAGDGVKFARAAFRQLERHPVHSQLAGQHVG